MGDSFGVFSNRLQGLNIIIVLRASLIYIHIIQEHFRPSKLGHENLLMKLLGVPESSFWLVLQAKLGHEHEHEHEQGPIYVGQRDSCIGMFMKTLT